MTPKDNQPQSVGVEEFKDALVALAWMYIQYCGPDFGHNFMGAGEDAIEILEKYGLGNERDGVDEVALNKLEQGSDLVAPKPLANADAANPPSSPATIDIDRLKKNNQVRKFMAKYRYQYHQTMLNDLVTMIADLITEKENRARVAEVNIFPFVYPDQAYIAYKKKRLAELEATLKSKGRDK